MTESPLAKQLATRLDDRSAQIAVIGLGYVGLPLVDAMHRAGFRVLGFDVDHAKVDMLERGETYLHHLGEEMVTNLSQSDRFTPTSNPADLRNADAHILCVPTPLGTHMEPDLTYVERSTELVAGIIKDGAIVTLESTTWPGTTREVCLPILEAAGKKLGETVFVGYSPEREDPGRKDHSTQSIPKLVGGLDPLSGQLAAQMYRAGVAQVVEVDTAEIAEAAKLLENIYRAVNIALVNELKPVLHDMGIDIWKVVDAAKTKPFGFQAFYPGPGLGGHCIPIDPFYLTWKAKEVGHHTKFIELAGQINNAMPHYVVDRTAEALNERGKPLKGSKVLVLGLAYKADVDDVRETPAAEILTLLHQRGADVAFHDPHVSVWAGMRRYPDVRMESEALTAERLQGSDAVLVVTAHKAIDWQLVADHADVIVDSRNAMAKVGDTKGLLFKA